MIQVFFLEIPRTSMNWNVIIGCSFLGKLWAWTHVQFHQNLAKLRIIYIYTKQFVALREDPEWGFKF
jgi:hypothetical protein